MSGIVLDTSIVSFAFKGNSRFDPYVPDLHSLEWFVSFQTIAEMRLGGLSSRWGFGRRERLESFLGTLQVVGFTDELATCWAQVMNETRQAGRRLEAGDAWIAATSRLLNVPLVTHDRDFANLAVLSATLICHA